MVNMERTSVAATQISAQSHAKIGPILDGERFEASASCLARGPTGDALGSVELAHPLHTLEQLLKKTRWQFRVKGRCGRLLQSDPQFIRRGR